MVSEPVASRSRATIDSLRRSLSDPDRVCSYLGIERRRRQRNGLIALCPFHAERTASFSVRCVEDHLYAHCFGCGWSGDVFRLVAERSGFDLSRDFREVLKRCAEMSGDHDLALSLGSTGDVPEYQEPPRPPEIEYAPQDELEQLWRSCGTISSDPDAWEYLRGRGIDPDVVDTHGLARVLGDGDLPDWARSGHRGVPWGKSGHRIIMRMFDHVGRFRSVRAWNIWSSDGPKRLPPRGYRSSGLVMANEPAWRMLRHGERAGAVTVCEGEPDTLVASTTYSVDAPVIGLISGSWTARIARAIPDETPITIRTHADHAGEKYARQVIEAIGERCPIWKSSGRK